MEKNDIIIIGIAGGTGSGKTTITKKIEERFQEEVTVLYHDDYYKARHDLTYEERVKLNYDHPAAFDTELYMTLEKLDLGSLSLGSVMVIEAEFTAGDALGVLQKFHHPGFVFGCFCFDVLGMDAVSGVDEGILFAEFASAVEVCRVAGHMDECFWLCNLGGCRFFFGGAAFGREVGCLETL